MPFIFVADWKHSFHHVIPLKAEAGMSSGNEKSTLMMLKSPQREYLR